MTAINSIRGAFAAAAAAATLVLGAGAASAGTVQVTIDFGTVATGTGSPYVEDGFAIAGSFLELTGIGNPPASIFLDQFTASLTLTRVGGGAFSLLSFQYACAGVCDFSVGGTAVTSGSSSGDVFATFTPVSGFTDLTSLVFTRNDSFHRIDNIVLSYDDAPAVIPLPAGLPLLAGGLAGLGLMARRRRKAA